MSFRKLLILVHRWTGLTIGLLSAVLAVTGAGLAVRPLLDGIVYRPLLVASSCAAPLPIDAQVAAARAAHPEGEIAYTRIQPGSGTSTMVRFAGNESIFVDPCTGTVLGTQNRYEGIFGRLEQLHRLAYWTNGLPNKFVKGSAALVLGLASVAGGLVLWWPRRRNGWRRALTVDPALRGRAFALNLHWTTGIYTSLVVFVIAMTGVPLAFDWAKQGLYAVTGSRPPDTKFTSAPPPEGQGGLLPMETAWQVLRTAVPDPVSVVFRYPHKPGEAIEIFAIDRTAPHGEARSYLFLDATSGKVLSFQPYAGLSAGRKLYYWMLAIHTGRAGGWPVDLVLFVGMLGVPVMAYTGVESYLRSRRRRRVAAGTVPARKAIG
jgi:vanillate O-demethylase ferredoxin subunit